MFSYFIPHLFTTNSRKATVAIYTILDTTTKKSGESTYL
jgi:hypothetical protein